MSYTVDYDAPVDQGNTPSTTDVSGGLQITHGVLILFLFFLGLYMLASYGLFRKINNAL